MQGLKVPPDLLLCLTDLIADYMLDRLRDYMHPDPAVPLSVPSPFIPVYAVQQADRFAEMLALAYNNPVVINIDAKHLQEALNGHDYGTNAKREADLLRQFNVPEIPPIMGPTVLVDMASVVLLWSLLEVLSSHFQVSAYLSTAWAATDVPGPHVGGFESHQRHVVPQRL
ncbi:hypothetical protein BDN67DRAFT_1008115 [Paxillus ammoniavirescens]|nr:hypothetical protein BDN67DRAFT_1008115 [Paxillus ammoniavirescens]